MKYAKISQDSLELIEIVDECGPVTNEHFWLGVPDDISVATHVFDKATAEFRLKE